MKHGKKYEEAKKLVDKSKAYPLTEAVALLKKVSYTKFDA
jgi:large subunit ribosomal protein L1